MPTDAAVLSDPHSAALGRVSERLALAPPLLSAAELTADRLAELKAAAESVAFRAPAAAAQLGADLVALTAGDPAAHALARWISGNIRFLLDQPLDALAELDAAAAGYAALGDDLAIARVGVSRMSALDKTGRYEEALAHAAAILPALERSPDYADQRRVASVHNGIGISSEHVGRYVEALEAYERKAAWWRGQPGSRAAQERARALVNIGLVNTRLGQYPEAREAYIEARDTLRQLAGPPDGDRQAAHDAARAAMNLAGLEAVAGSPAAVTAAAFAAARELRAAVDPAGEATDFALLDLSEAEWRLQTGAPAADADTHRRLAALQRRLKRAGLAYEASRGALLLARLALARGETADAAAAFAAVASEAQRRGDPEIAFLAAVGRARAWAAAGDTAAGQRSLQKALTAVERMRAALPAEEHRIGFLTNKLIAYRELAALCLDAGDWRGAVATIERSKARALAEVIAADATVAATSFDIADTWPRLPDGTLLLVYGALPAGRPAGAWLCAFDRRGPVGRPMPVGALPDSDDLRAAITRITAPLRMQQIAARFPDQLIRSGQSPLAAWFEAYLGPIAPLLPAYDRLLIAPDDVLNALPFNALYDRAGGRYLVETHTVEIAPSLATWRTLRARPATATGRPLVVGCAPDGDLPHVADEARAVAAALGDAELLLEDAATRAAFAAACEQAPVIHVATHGKYRPDAPAFSHILLADGRLEARDIARLRLAADTVALSACETGAGRLTGNELLGLARAFLHAGARSVVATHWKVDDAATARLMTTFSAGLAAGLDAAAALRRGQLAALAAPDETGPALLATHPCFWGAATAVGAARG